MTKAQLIKALEPFDDGIEICMFIDSDNYDIGVVQTSFVQLEKAYTPLREDLHDVVTICCNRSKPLK